MTGPGELVQAPGVQVQWSARESAFLKPTILEERAACHHVWRLEYAFKSTLFVDLLSPLLYCL